MPWVLRPRIEAGPEQLLWDPAYIKKECFANSSDVFLAVDFIFAVLKRGQHTGSRSKLQQKLDVIIVIVIVSRKNLEPGARIYWTSCDFAINEIFDLGQVA